MCGGGLSGDRRQDRFLAGNGELGFAQRIAGDKWIAIGSLGPGYCERREIPGGCRLLWVDGTPFGRRLDGMLFGAITIDDDFSTIAEEDLARVSRSASL